MYYENISKIAVMKLDIIVEKRFCVINIDFFLFLKF
jgi:hypothetical protein